MLSQEQQNLLYNAIMSPDLPSLRECNRAGIENMLCGESVGATQWACRSTLYFHRTKYNGIDRVAESALGRRAAAQMEVHARFFSTHHCPFLEHMY